jgi:trehalose/maltose hydrolase-like predicted phosphorylase
MVSWAEKRSWQVSDAPFNPFKLSHTETIYTIGNGYMGLRGTFEEGYPNEMVSTLVHGIFNHAEGDLVPDIVNLPNPLPIVVEINDEAFHMKSGSILGYERTLNLQTGLLQRAVLWRNSKGVVVRITFSRFASLENQHLLAQSVEVIPLSGPANVRIYAAFDAKQTNMGVNHWAEINNYISGDQLLATATTNQSGYRIGMAGGLISPNNVNAASRNDAQSLFTEATLEQNQAFTAYKLSAIHTSRDADDPLAAAQKTLAAAKAAGYDSLYKAHVKEWAAYWDTSDLQIDGDEAMQRALRFTTYHVLIAAPRNEEHSSIGAKTLSGPGYKGHVFWDTELFMVPMLTVTQPRLSRNLLMYRYHNLQGARNKAQKAGYEGAMFPWESTDTGEETTPQWTHPLPDGSRIRIWTGDNEQHISTDIAYAVMQFWGWTRDDEWFTDYGAEIVLDTAVFWGSRAEYNKEADRYELSMQIGPDEYHDNINNSAFTNSMARWHLNTALRVVDWLQKHQTTKAKTLLDRLKIDETRTNHWQHIIDKMYIPRDAQTGLLEQFDGFFKLERVELGLWKPKVNNYDSIVGHAKMQTQMVIKQADVVMLMSLIGDQIMTPEEQQRNWDFYYPVVDHGSSLSPSTHAQVAARLKLIEDAYYMLHYAANIDLEDLKGNVRDGIHAAASGGLWQAIVFGFCGLQLAENGYTTDPHFPKHWRSVSFTIYYGGEKQRITLHNPNQI